MRNAWRFPTLIFLAGAILAAASVPASAQAPAGARNAAPAATPAPPLAPAAAGTPGNPCGGNARCYSAGPFAATVTGLTAVQSATSRANRTISLNVEFRNLGNQPITLAYKARTSAAVDNQSNQFVDGGVTGIGVADGRSVDTQFVLNPGQTRSARFALWRRADRTVIGTAWTWDVTIAEVQVLANGQQVQTVKEDSMHFTNLVSEGPTNTNNTSVQASTPAGARNAPTAATPAPPLAPAAAGTPGNPCGGNARCYSAGPFAATVTGLTAVQSATSRANRTISLNVEFRNLGNQPITLAYKARTSVAVDNQSNQFVDGGVTGIGVADGRSVDTQFVLNPGQTRSARFALWRRADRTVIGTAWTWDVTIAEVQVLANGQQVQTVKEDSMHFTNLVSEGPTNANNTSAPGTTPADAIKSLGGIFGRK